MKKKFPVPEKLEKMGSFVFSRNIGFHAAHASFFVVLAVFPALVLILSLLRYTGLEVEVLTDMLHGIVPEALFDPIRRLILSAYYNSSGTMVSVSALLALWSASRGIYGLLVGLNAIYDTQENHNYWQIRGLSVVYTVAFLLILILTLVLHVFSTPILQMIPQREGLWGLLADVIDLRFFVLFLLQTGVFTAMFMVLPGHRNRFMESLPGALLASIGWLTFSDIFSIYVENFTNYANIYGSVYAVALSMLWLYSCLSIVFYGGVLNRWIILQNKKEMNKP